MRKEYLEKNRKGAGRRREFEYDCNIHSGRERFGFALEVFIYSVRLDFVARHER